MSNAVLHHRVAWNWIHHSNGYVVILLALANAFIGMYLGDLQYVPLLSWP